MKKILGITAVSFLLCAFTFNYNSNTFYQYECIEIGNSSKIKIWSTQKGSKYNFNDALKNAVQLILFEGLNGDKCISQSPLLNSLESKDRFKKIEEDFFSKAGEYSNFVNLVSKASENRGVKKHNNITVYIISVSTQQLQQYLINKEIIQPLNQGF
jgi:hypothetical protein